MLYRYRIKQLPVSESIEIIKISVTLVTYLSKGPDTLYRMKLTYTHMKKLKIRRKGPVTLYRMKLTYAERMRNFDIRPKTFDIRCIRSCTIGIRLSHAGVRRSTFKTRQGFQHVENFRRTSSVSCYAPCTLGVRYR